MNTLAHIAALVALLWLSVVWGFRTLEDPQLAFAVLILFFLWIPLTLLAIIEDVGRMNEARRRRRG